MLLEISSNQSKKQSPKPPTPLEEVFIADVKMTGLMNHENEISKGEKLEKEWKKYRNEYESSYDATEIKALKKINDMIANLVETNR